ncbi:hypothetical protein U9M48_005972 [Paspalum notatum var. saurae]|uniref:PIN-like protein n=1 Tax=Paspalum notatum var. saurae TaxID=547442 RepID=A0AAQ3PXS7_PASNO
MGRQGLRAYCDGEGRRPERALSFWNNWAGLGCIVLVWRRIEMRFWSLLTVAWLPVLQVLLVGLLGALLASSRFDVLTSDARRNINKIVYIVFVPSLVFSSLSTTVTLKDIVSWWFMPVNMSIMFLIGAVLGWTYVKAFRPGEQLQGLIIACNWGSIPLMIVPAICNEEGSPFGDAGTCNSLGLSYVSLSMAISFPLPTNDIRDSFFFSYYLRRAKGLLVEILKELWSPPSVAAVVGFSVGAIEKVKSVVTEEGSPLRVIQDSTKLLGDAAIPCTVLILGGNLTKGIGKTTIKPIVVISIIVIRFVLLPTCGISIVTAATKLGFLPESPLYGYILLLQSTVPPAMSIGTIAQLFDVGEEECSIIFLWTHPVAALALMLWSTVFMSLVM